MKKPSKERLLSELQILRKFTEKLDFFKKLIEKHGQDYHHKCCSALKYEYYPKGSLIIEYGNLYLYIYFNLTKKTGSMGKNFYIILQGTVGIMIPTSPTTKRRKNSFDNIKLFDKAFLHDNVPKKNIPDSNKKEEIQENSNELEKKDDLVEIKTLSVGETFGEYSLISNQPTQASIKSIEDCYFAVLEKKDFNAILSDY